MAALDKTLITTRILYDRVAHMAGLESFGNNVSAVDFSSLGHFLQAYYELHAADYSNSGTDPCRQLLRSNALYYSSRNQVLMGALRYRFNYIDTNAVRNQQFYCPGGLPGPIYDIAGRTSSPYLQRDVLVGAALADTLKSRSTSFVLDPASCFSNIGSALLSANVNFGDGGGSRVCLPSQPVAITYPTAGRKIITFTFVYADGRRLTTRSEIHVKQAAVGCTSCRTTVGPDEIVPCRTVPLTAARAFQGAFGKAEISYFYSTMPQKPCDASTPVNVTKPAIIIDGFDHEDKRNAYEIFNKSLAYRTVGNQAAYLGTELRDAGYDVVVMNLPNVFRAVTVVRNANSGPYTYYELVRRSGSDYIERNGLALVSLIEELNRQTAAAGSTEELVVVGPSMAGQIARYALAYMEANNISHRTRLYIALDSPHNGANVPIGLQRFVRHYADFTGEGKLVSALEAIDAPASREMTLQHYNFNNNNDDVTAFAPHPDRLTFMNNLNALRPGGFPSNIRRVAVTNGALNGAAQKDQNNVVIHDTEQAFLLQVRGIPASIWGLFTRTTTTASARVYFSPGWGGTSTSMRTYKLGSGERVYDATGPASSCGLDAGPGGYRNFFYEVSNDNSFNRALYSQTFYSVHDRASFIPMLSALGCTNAGYNNCTGVTSRSLVCNNATPFDAYYGPAGVNEEHTQLTAGNVAFLKDEILKQTPAPVLVRPLPGSLCSVSGATVATVAVVPECLLAGRTQPATTYTWRVNIPGVNFGSGTQQGTTLTTTTGSSVQIIANLNADTYAQVQVTATRAGYAASSPVSFNIQVSPSSRFLLDYVAPNAYAHDGIVPAYENVSFGIDLLNYDSPSIRWYVNNSATPFLGSNGLPVSGSMLTTNVGAGVSAIAPAMNTFTVRAEGTSLCDGHRESQTLQLRLGTGPNYNPNRLAVTGGGLQTYPNPVRDVVSIFVEEPAGSAKTGVAATANVQLFDAYGHLVRQTQATGSRFTLDTHSLPVGMYNLVVIQGPRVLRKHIEISN